MTNYKTTNKTSLMKFLLNLIIVPALLLSINCNGQIKNAKTETVNVYGNCGTCKKNIETAAYKKKVSSGVWDEDTKVAKITYDSTKTTSDAILKSIALAGYDNMNYLAPDAAYSKLNECCKYERKQTSNVLAKNNSKENSKDGMTSISEDKNSENLQQNVLSAVYGAYFGLKDALIKGDGNVATEKAKDLHKEVDAVPMSKLPVAQHTVWMKYMKDISDNAELIKGTTKIDQQREYFTKLSTAMYEVMKSIKADYPVYFDHCPMYNNGKGGDWLSKESEIKNPYYGSQMLSCGKTVETIK